MLRRKGKEGKGRGKRERKGFSKERKDGENTGERRGRRGGREGGGKKS